MGISLDEIQNLEVSEFDDWLKASEVLDLEDKIQMVALLNYFFGITKEGNRKFRKLQTDMMLKMGINPYEPNRALIAKTQEYRKKYRKVKVHHGNREGNSNQADAR